ncbi:hypothetical protein [Halospina sp. K52047b]|uniref:hypothetical protein n=1 Tax=Halospina sp. K52047b TaxID=2614160 RepID=UPI00124AB549|nr:hypothetical protein [Halospina sp. K52047b]KAA8983015.1 hypothetical protein F3089_07785 [Halospina sp. K52047b]
MKGLKITALGMALAFAGGAQAQLAGKNVILIHGLQGDDIAENPTSQQEIEQNGDAYWQAFWASRAEARIDWGSHERVEGRTAERAFNQLVEISQQGLCSEGCIVVTHSTGDLVGRYVLDNQARWLSNAGLEPLNVIAALDFAGAGGGSELADLAVNAAYADSFGDELAKLAVTAYLGTTPTPENLGVLRDLQPAVARNIATSPNSVPRLRFVGGGSNYGGLTGPFLPGIDDGVVALHSTCGGTQVGSYKSCVSNVALDGKRTSVSAPSGLYYNHYPVLMGEKVDHSQVINTESGNTLTYANNGFSVSGVSVNFQTETYEERPWWKFWGSGDTYQVVTDSEQSSVSGLVYQTLN